MNIAGCSRKRCSSAGSKTFNDLSIDDKVKFFEAIKEKWTKNDPTEFFSTKEADQLDAVVVTK